MADTKSFSQYLAEAQKKVGTPTAGASTNPWKSTKPVATTKFQSEPNKGDFWSGLLSVLGSAKYAITNVPNQILNEQQKAYDAEQAGTDYNLLGGIGNVVASPVTGFFSGLTNTGPENKIDFAPLIEKTADVANINNPSYKDVENNIDPAFAGTFGLAGDIVLDPITWVPPAAVAKVAGAVGKVASTAGKALSKAPKTSEEAAATLRQSANVADTSPKAVAEKEALLNTYGVEDIKEAPSNIPSGTTSDISPATAVAKEAEKGARQASKTAANAEAGIKAEATFDYPTFSEKLLKDLPTVSGGRTPLTDMANFIAGVRAGKGAPALSLRKWNDSLKPRLQNAVRLGTATEKEKKLLAALNDPQQRKAIYDNIYLKNYNESGGKTNLVGQPKESTGFKSMDEYVASLDDAADAVLRPGMMASAVGRKYLTGAEAKEAYVMGTHNGKKIPPPQLKEIREQLQAGFDEAAVASGDESFIANFKAIIKENEAGANAMFGKNLAKTMRKAGPSTLSYMLKSIEDIAAGRESLDNFVRYLPGSLGEDKLEPFSYVAKSLGELLGVGDPVAYNLARRKALSEINTAKSAEYAKLIEEGADIEQFLITSGVTSEDAANVKKWFPEWLAKRVTAAKLELETSRGIKRTKDTMGEGEAFNIRELGTYDGWELVMGAMKEALKEAKLRGLSGGARANFVRTKAMNELAIVEKAIDEFGWPMWLGVSTKNSRFLVSPSQLMSAMFAADKKLTDMVMFNGTTAGPYTFMADAITESLILGKPINRARLEEHLLGDADVAHYATINKKFKRPANNGFEDGGVYGYGKDGKQVEYSGEDLIDMFEEALPKILNNLEDVIKTNSEAFSTRFGAEAGDLSNESLKQMVALGADVTRIDRLINYVDQLGQNVAAIGHRGAALDLSILRAVEVVTGLVPKGIRTFATTTVKGQKKAKVVMKDVVVPPKANKATREKVAKNADKKAEKAAQPAMAERLDDYDKQYDEFVAPADEYVAGLSDEIVDSVKTGGRINAKFTGMMNPLDDVWGALASRFNRYYDQKHVANIWHSLGGTVARIRHNYTHKLKEIEKANDNFPGTNTPIATKVFQDLQVGIRTPGYESMYDQLKALTAEVHDVSGVGNTLNDPFFQSQQGIETINEYLRLGGIDDAYHINLDSAIQDAAANGTDMWTEASKQWTLLKIDDPVQYLAKRHAALMKMNLHIAVAHDFERMAFANNMAWVAKGPKDVPPAGFVKAEGLDGFFFKFLPENTYFDAMIMRELQILSDISQQSRAIGGKLGDFLNKYILPIQNDWKYAITLPRPGHHIRNGIGDASLTFQAEGARHYMKSSNDAFKILAVNKSYEDVDLFNALRNKGINTVPMQGDVLVRAKGVDITNRWAFDTMQKNGLLPSYHVGEDYVDDVVQPSVISNITKKLTLRGGKIEETAGKFSEARDHYARAQHFMQIMRKHANDPKFKNIDELVEYASKRVKKFHPDSSMLTNFEAKYLRTLIPFYSWFRGALPAIIEATALHPGRFMVFPKVSYNLAYSMGINPASIYDPFPDDQMFPSFLTEDATGPQFNIGGNYFGMNPGIAALDVGNQLGTGEPLRGIAGMTSPLFRVPLELMSGGSWGTGARIKDPSDYVDASIPGINYLSNITGVSPTGSVASFLQGQGLDRQYQVDAGNKGPEDQATSFMNWFTGLGFQNMSKPNYINYAEIEKRNEAAKDQRSAY